MKHVIALLITLALFCGSAALADDRADMLLAVAVNELGYASTKGGYSKYGEWGGNAYGEWCSEFVSWCVNEADAFYNAGMLNNDYPLQTSCDEGAAWFQAQERYVCASGEMKNAGVQFYYEDGALVSERPYVPQRGDLIYIEWYAYNRLDHVGIVEFVSQDAQGNYIVHTIEGNNHILGVEPTEVARYTYTLDDASIRGYGILSEKLVGTVVESGSSGEAVALYQRRLRDLGYYDGDCAGKFGKATQTATEKYQKDHDLKVTGCGDIPTQRAMMAEIRAEEEAAEQRALEAAHAEAKSMLETAKTAIASAWFGEFDPYDEEAAWARLMADITVLDVDQKEKIYLSDAPNGKRQNYEDFKGYVFGESVHVKVLDEQDGWSKIEIYNDCDELEQGWVRPGRLKTVTPNQTYGIIVDKMTQRLYLYKDGKLETTLLCSTGSTSGSNKLHNETASGEFLLCSSTGGFWAGNLWCDLAMRFNGGDLMHLVPAVVSADGSVYDYAICESALGSRASHGCIRVQRVANEDGYNHQWLWDNLRKEKNIKLIVWDDDGRKLDVIADSEPVYYNPDGGKNYHADQYCPAVRSAYLPLAQLSYGDLRKYPYTELTPCGTCGAPKRPEAVEVWNATIDQAYEELGLTP